MENQRSNKRAVLGVILVIVGFILIGANFNIFPFGLRNIVFSWQAVLILIGLFFLLSREANASGWILIGIGGFFLIPRLWDVPWGWHELFWPAMLLGLGAVLIVRGVGRRKEPGDDGQDYK